MYTLYFVRLYLLCTYFVLTLYLLVYLLLYLLIDVLIVLLCTSTYSHSTVLTYLQTYNTLSTLHYVHNYVNINNMVCTIQIYSNIYQEGVHY